MVVIMALGAMAQNANRSGFFAEFGAGVFTGKTPRTSVGRTMDDRFVYTLAKGCALDLSIGYRLRFADHWAYEWRFGLEASTKEFNALFNPKIFPVGFRYTSSEFFRNTSFYVHVNLGISSCPKGNPSEFTPPVWGAFDLYTPDSSCKLSSSFGFNGNSVLGFVYTCGVGINITNSLYTELVYDSQINACNEAYYKIHRIGSSRIIYWGSVGLRVGYRF